MTAPRHGAPLPAPKTMRTERLWRALVPVAVLALALGAWQLAVDLGRVPAYLLPSPTDILGALVEDSDILFRALRMTVILMLEALALAVIGGVGLAVLMSRSRWIELALSPFAVILQVTPIVAIAPVLIVWVPTEVALLVIAFIVAFFPILANTAQGLRSADRNLRDLFELHGAGRRRTLLLLEAPSALPYFFTGLRIAGGLALIAAVVAEFAAGSAGADSGLAFRLFEAQFRYDTPRAFAALFLLSLTGLLMFLITSLLSHLALRRWHESATLRET